ncbi:hypothetical protein EVAR_19554_1 [Eumeta japonica]|uniref:Uncharacterized protein n=1 Tax=Eumeta variegata TaxID=151549 RepID=A0A4C1UGM9_EUMVA|nr:hypothetical protein EVAR_19554_1 [Eumeta japonica]
MAGAAYQRKRNDSLTPASAVLGVGGAVSNPDGLFPASFSNSRAVVWAGGSAAPSSARPDTLIRENPRPVAAVRCFMRTVFTYEIVYENPLLNARARAVCSERRKRKVFEARPAAPKSAEIKVSVFRREVASSRARRRRRRLIKIHGRPATEIKTEMISPRAPAPAAPGTRLDTRSGRNLLMLNLVSRCESVRSDGVTSSSRIAKRRKPHQSIAVDVVTATIDRLYLTMKATFMRVVNKYTTYTPQITGKAYSLLREGSSFTEFILEYKLTLTRQEKTREQQVADFLEKNDGNELLLHEVVSGNGLKSSLIASSKIIET